MGFSSVAHNIPREKILSLEIGLEFEFELKIELDFELDFESDFELLFKWQVGVSVV